MIKHKTRTYLICFLAIACIASLLAAVALSADGSVIAALLTATGIFVPAAADSLSVEKRRRKRGTPAIVDDVVGSDDNSTTD